MSDRSRLAEAATRSSGVERLGEAPQDSAAGRRKGPDGATVLTVYLCLLLLIPSDQTIGGLGDLGVPAIIWGLGCFLWWVWETLSRGTTPGPLANPVRIALVVFFAAVLLSYVFAMLRAIPEAEVTPADRNLIQMFSFLGVALVALDGIPDFGRLTILLRRFVIIAALIALIGIAEFIVGAPIARTISVPGLTGAGDIGIDVRGEFPRPSATAVHPLEYSMVLAVAFPISLILALRSTGWARTTMITTSALIGLALLLGGSRSAILGLAVGTLPLLLTFTVRERIATLFAGVLALGAVYIAVPGMLGTLANLFASADEDSSVLSRTAGLGLFSTMFPISPWVGRGLGTFLPRYRIFDNQYLTLLLEIGIIGTLAFAALYVTAIICVVRTRRHAPLNGALNAALAASSFVAITLCALFDAMSFAKSLGLLALVPGLCGSLWALTRRGGNPADTPRTKG